MALYLSEQDVRSVLDMPLALECVEQAHRWHAEGEAIDTPRARSRTPQSALHVLQAAVLPLGLTGCKLYTSSREGARFWVHLFDAATGRPLAVIEADWLGRMRTGAMGGLGARLLAREDARVACVFGAGGQARSQIEALLSVRAIEELRVFSRRPEALEAFCAALDLPSGCRVQAATSAESAMRGADVVVTITTSATPVFDGNWLEPGCHVTAAGSNALIRREVDETAVRRASVVVVDSRATAVREAGDLLPALEKGRLQETQLVEIGDVLLGRRCGRRDRADITLFESQGMGIQDLVLAHAVLERACSAGLGRDMPY